MKTILLKDVKKGDLFRFCYANKAARTKVAEGYNRSTRKYAYCDYEDINWTGEAAGSKIVSIDF